MWPWSGKRVPGFRNCAAINGEKIVLPAQQLGLNPCWVAMPHKKVPSALRVEPGESLCYVISIGYGATQGRPTPSKTAPPS